MYFFLSNILLRINLQLSFKLLLNKRLLIGRMSVCRVVKCGAEIEFSVSKVVWRGKVFMVFKDLGCKNLPFWFQTIPASFVSEQ